MYDGNINMNELIEKMGIDDPKLKTLAQLLSNQNNSREETEVEKKVARVSHQQREIIKKLKSSNHLLMGNLEYLIERNDLLASALGACPDCWGEDRACEVCHGQGTAGTYKLDGRAFNQYVRPCLDRLTQKKDKNQTNK